ncbi:patatin-like phospholipase family protein [Odoribacter sp. OttesenSCG-928-G04]|nr:patatin-like phospholipase family protein [Odoribacter sp. OttesenSCG-928-G04]
MTTKAKKDCIYNLGLALSGGGTRGFAHLGAIQAMYEYGLKPDVVSGTSAGSIVGAMICSGKEPHECLEFFLKKKLFDFTRLTISKKGLLSFDQFAVRLQKFLKVSSFEELQIPLIITATDIDHAQSVHFSSGELIQRILASCSIPVVFVPTTIDGIQYVDGGLFMNLPVRPIRKLCEKVIAIEINSFENSLKIENMLHVAERSFHLGLASNTAIDRKMADLLIAPENMLHYSMLDLKAAEKIFNLGYEAAKERLKDFSLQQLHHPSSSLL